jgi:hypothetical protein
MRTHSLRPILASALAALALAACNPTFNWRSYNSPHAPYTVMFPDKPASHTRSVNLNGLVVNMTMTAVDINGTMFAVGTAEAPDEAAARAALPAMKMALVKNIGATITREKTGTSTAAAGSAVPAGPTLDIEANGQNRGEPMRLVGHFAASGKRFYQVIAMGKARDLTPENVDMFMSSFKLQ